MTPLPLPQGCRVIKGKDGPVHVCVWTCGPPPKKGQRQRYPSRFWYYFRQHYPEIIPATKRWPEPRVLHMFSGSMKWGDTTDIRADTGAKIVAPYDLLPIPPARYDWVVADPPYTTGFANEWTTHPKDHPKPRRIQIEAARVTKPGGKIGILHIISVPAYAEAKVRRVGAHFVWCGPNNAVRLFSVFERL